MSLKPLYQELCRSEQPGDSTSIKCDGRVRSADDHTERRALIRPSVFEVTGLNEHDANQHLVPLEDILMANLALVFHRSKSDVRI